MKFFHNRIKVAALGAAPVIALATAIATGAFTQHASAQTPNSKKPFAVGGFTTTTEHVAFAVAGSLPSGHVVQELATGTNSGPVTCFGPSGNMALITFLVTSGPDYGNYRTFTVVDGGEPNMGVPPDMYSDCGNQGTSGSDNCAANNCMMQPILRGNIVVSSGR